MKRRMVATSLSMALVFMASFVSCDKFKDWFMVESDEFTVEGTVSNGTTPLAGVVVTSPEGGTVSNAQGQYKVGLPEGTHTLTFKSQGLPDQSRTVTGKTGDVVKLDVSMQPSSSTNPNGEYVFTAGDYVEKVVDPNGGWIEFEVWIPESGRRNDWGFAAVLEMYQDTPNRYASFLPYKIKTCAYRDCREPRYSLPWNQWRKVRFEWNQAGVLATIDGTRVGAGFPGAWTSAPVKLCYGHRPHRYGPMEGVKMRNIVWSN